MSEMSISATEEELVLSVLRDLGNGPSNNFDRALL